MRNRKTQGFTLIELLIVIAIIGILAAVLIPNLLNARKRAFDTAAQTCLKEIATNEEMAASVDPWEYTAGQWEQTADASDNGISSCNNVDVTSTSAEDGTTYSYTAEHANGANEYSIAMGTGVQVVVAPVVP
jgi:type IV pilus assembly protein PilA